MKIAHHWLVCAASAGLVLGACDEGGSSSDGSGDVFEQDGSVFPGDGGMDVEDSGSGTPDATDGGDPSDGDAGGDADGTSPDTGDTDPVDADADADVTPLPTDWPEDADLVRITLDGGDTGTGSATASLGDFPALDDLGWLTSEGVRCYDNAATTDEFFSGNHIPFVLDEIVPEWSEVTVTVTPSANNSEAVFYVLVQAPNTYQVPPEVDAVGYCHMPVQFGGPGAASTVTFQTYGGQPRDILIGVSNRGRFAGDDTADVTVDVSVTKLAGADICYGPIEDPDRWPENIQYVTLDSEGRGTVVGRLSEGAPVCGDEQWIDDAFCAPATRLDRFGGNHVFYVVEGGIPENSIMTVTAVPDPGVDISLYSSRQGTELGFRTPPSFEVSDCDASYDIRPGNGSDPGQTESLYLTATTNPYEVFIGVAGDDEQVTDGGYTLAFQLITYESDLCTEEDYAAVSGLDEWPSNVTAIDGTQGFSQVNGTTADGDVPCTLDWAASSQNACFPATRFSFFRGATDYYILDPPPPVGSTVSVRAVPVDDDVEVSLFGYRLVPGDVTMPPLVNGVITCEASYTFGIGEEPNPGEAEEIEFYNSARNQNPYTYFIGVSAYNDGEGDDQLAGGYRLEVQVNERPPAHCEESLPGATYPTWPGFTTGIAVDASGAGSASGDLSTGSCVNLDFASRSDVACFPSTQNDRFEGNHVFFHLDEPIPPHSELYVTITPDSGVDVNAYGMQIADYEYSIPPNVNSAICESSFDYSGPNPGEAETLYFANPTDRSMYNIMIAVAGDDTTGTSGGFDIDVQLNTSTIFCEDSLPGPTGLTEWPSDVEVITIGGDNEATATGNLSTGSCTNLDFAEQSDVACFPSVRFDRFTGNQNFYAIEEDLAPNSFVTITVNPTDPSTDLSLYGLRLGNNEFAVPPAINNTQCDASYALGLANPGESESITFYNPSTNSGSYNIFFAVAGANGLESGAYDIEIRRTSGTIHCEESLPGQFYSRWPSNVQQLRLVEGVAEQTGNLNNGECTNLDFAANSNLACYPATLFDEFEGNQVFFALAEPLAPNQIVRVSAEATGGTPVNLYGYTVGSTGFYVPPAVPGGTCEYALDADEPTGAHSIQFDTGRGDPVNLFFAVAGQTAATAGAFRVRVEILD